jgi:hypothetical protein
MIAADRGDASINEGKEQIIIDSDHPPLFW